MSFYLGAYWGPRPETAEQCAHRLARCLNMIGPYSPLIASWYDVRAGVTAAAPPTADWVLVSAHEDAIAERLRKGVNRKDTTADIIVELGFGARFWNLLVREEGGANLSVQCGCWSEYVTNNFLVDIPARKAAPELYQPQTARALMEAVVKCWEPDWATWTSRHLRALQRHGDAPVTKPLGWATYFSTLPEPPPDLPAGAQLSRLGAGWLVTVGNDPGEVSETLLLAVRDALGEKSLA